jgi:NAD(P)-dependent dehydrogenase (short-subunit alcohol dehydrogenase family)
MTPRPTVLIAGLGEGLGVALTGAFAAAGHDVVALSRSGRSQTAASEEVARNGGTFVHIACDLTRYDELSKAIVPIASRIEVLVHAAHALLIRPFAEVSPAAFESVWRISCLSAMHVASLVLPAMAARGKGVAIFTGATASLRGSANFAAVASAKFALRGLVQVIAREFGAKGVHVAHMVLDGLLDEPQSAERFGPSSSGRMDPAAVATAYVNLACQPPSAWTHELDLRPSTERF